MADASTTAIDPPLPQVAGYVVVVVIGLLIAAIMFFVTRTLKKKLGEDNRTSEMFMVANRSVGTGLTASAVISSWLWSTAMLASSLVGYNFGVSGPFWFAAGCSPMIVFFAVLGITCKLRIPEAHTLLEIVRIRYGKTGHIVWIVLCLINNIIAVANMLLGASAAITALTGMHITASIFLLPLGVSIYTFVGGIKATFLTDYIHTFIITIIICWFTIKTFNNPGINSIGDLYDKVVTASQTQPAGSFNGSYFTMTSKNALLFGIIHTLENFGLVIMDTGFFAKAFAARAEAIVPGYIIGGTLYFAIPLCFGTLASLSAIALQSNPVFPTYPRPLSATEVSQGLVLPYSAVAIAGQGGGVAILLVIFMAVTSTLSAQVISVSSIIAFDIYRVYINKNARDKDVIRWSHIGVVFFSLFSAGFSTALWYGGADLGWTLYMLGILTCPGIFPTVFTILWKRQSKIAAVTSPILGLITGVAVWLGTAKSFYGVVTIVSTGATLPCVYGTVASAFAPAVYSVILSLIFPANYDWRALREEKLAFEQHDDITEHDSLTRDAAHNANIANYGEDKKTLKRWFYIAVAFSLSTFFGHWVLWPLPMYASQYVFSKQFFTAWIVVAIIWMWITMLVAGFYPIIDGFGQIRAIFAKHVLPAHISAHTESTQVRDEKDVEEKSAEVSSSSGPASIDSK